MMTTSDIHTDIVRELLKRPVGMVRGALHGSIVVASYKPSKDAENEGKVASRDKQAIFMGYYHHDGTCINDI